MAQGRLTLAVVAAGIAAEVVAPGATGWLTAGDLAAGAALALVALARPDRWLAAASLAAAVLWFAATLSGAGDGWVADAGAQVLLVHRAPVLCVLLLVARRPDPAAAVLAGAAWIAAVLPVGVAGPGTAGVGAAVAAWCAFGAASRREAAAAAALAAGLATVWLLAAETTASATGLALVDDALLVAVAGLAMAARELTLRGAVNALTIDLGPAAAPVVSRLRAVLGDPGLTLCFRLPEEGWIDETGAGVREPSAATATRATAPGGGEVALLHGPGAVGDPALRDAAARAAVLALDAARLNAAARGEAAAVRASRARLLTTGDEERRRLEVRLSAGPLARLDRVTAALETVGGTDALRSEAAATRTDLAAFATGVFPADADLDALAARAPVPVTVTVDGDLAGVEDRLRAAMYFVVSEALANSAKYAHATQGRVTVRVGPRELHVEIGDDGTGGAAAVAGGGLAGLTDRAEALGGRLSIVSPPGRGTVIAVRLPLG